MAFSPLWTNNVELHLKDWDPIFRTLNNSAYRECHDDRKYHIKEAVYITLHEHHLDATVKWLLITLPIPYLFHAFLFHSKSAFNRLQTMNEIICFFGFLKLSILWSFHSARAKLLKNVPILIFELLCRYGWIFRQELQDDSLQARNQRSPHIMTHVRIIIRPLLALLL